MLIKGNKGTTGPSAFERRSTPPGEQGSRRRGKISDYGAQLREKQKLRRIYGVMERQFRGYYELASRKRGITGEILLQLLERRLDNVVYRLGFAVNRLAARQLVGHGHVQVNGRKVDIPSYQVRVGDKITIREKSRELGAVKLAVETLPRRGGTPPWLEADLEKRAGALTKIPNRDEIAAPVQEQLIVELYSK